MTYPCSSDVSAGQPTAASQYNNLRADTLRLGQSADDAVTLGELLCDHHSHLSIEYLATNRLRVPASAALPVGLVVGSVPLRAVSNVDLPASQFSGAAATWYIFAVQTAASTTFSLEVNTSPAGAANKRLIGSVFYNGSQLVRSSIRTRPAEELASLLSLAYAQRCDGRLTLVSGVPVPVTEVTAAGTLFFSPYHGNRISLYNPLTGWGLRAFDELSISLSNLASGEMADVFVSDVGGNLELTLEVWSTPAARATALASQDGVLVQSGAPGCRYLGTLYANGSGTSEDSLANRLLWNCRNRVARKLLRQEPTDSWTHTSAVWRPFNNDSANRFLLVAGLVEDAFSITQVGMSSNSSANNRYIGICSKDGSDYVLRSAALSAIGATQNRISMVAQCVDLPALGLNSLYLCEYGASGTTFYGDYGVPSQLLCGGTGFCYA